MQFSRLLPRLFAAAALLLCVGSASADDTAPAWLAGYADDAQYNEQLQALDGLDLVSVRTLGESAGGRKLSLVTVGRGEADKKPAIAIVGSTDGKYLLGTELSMRMIRGLAEGAARDGEASKLLDRYTFYFLPRPDPDSAQKSFAKLLQTPAGNDRATDDDRDFEIGEDPADDLNGDGFITQMRVEDEKGNYVVHPSDDRLMVEADIKKNERGKYRVLIEGRDDDADEEFNEDGSGGVAIHHNFPHGYRAFKPHTGEHAASEPETQTLIDFFFDQPNIAMVFSFSPDDNLFHPWKASSDKERIRKSIFPDDATLLELIAADYKKLHGGSDAPSSPAIDGSLSPWGYFQYGRWSLSARGWWASKVEPKPKDAEPAGEKSESKADSDSESKKADAKPVDDKSADDKRAADERNLLRWMESQELEGFVPWQQIEHPDFPGQKVEVGGIKPLVGVNPSAKELDGLAEKHLKFILSLPSYLPEIAIIDAKAEPLGGQLYRVSAKVLNRGYLPTMPEMGSVNGQPHPLQFSIDLPKDAELIQGHTRERLKRLESGESAEKVWLVRFSKQPPEKIRLKAWAPAVGESDVEVPLK